MIVARAGERGFTLLELLVAITLLGMLMAALFGALRLGARVWETGEERLDAGTRVQVVQDFLRQQLGQTVPISEIGGDAGSLQNLVFGGGSQGLRFVSLLPAHQGGGTALMELGLRPAATEGEPGDLVLRIRPLDLTGNGTADEPGELRILIDAVESLEISYFGSAQSGADPIWWQEWQAQRSLPSLVRVRLAFPEGDPRRWPELIVGLLVDLPPPFQL